MDQNTFLSDEELYFQQDVGNSTTPHLFIFCHYLPCTLNSHNCADLPNELVKKTGRKVSIGYTEVFRTSDRDRALQTLNDTGIEVRYIPWQQDADLRQLSTHFKNISIFQRSMNGRDFLCNKRQNRTAGSTQESNGRLTNGGFS
ncbi:hypothetical protein DPMN_048599 [Dreissena polymorpha]|uniref:Uncharacterized protein n=1 Tax=Dreissena polymorpha TaxID=45954 RepID=A0A9D4DBY6_DREPO|nr:hypothetical protein DPMN_048599 [Dreissena polymorpha]